MKKIPILLKTRGVILFFVQIFGSFVLDKTSEVERCDLTRRCCTLEAQLRLRLDLMPASKGHPLPSALSIPHRIVRQPQVIGY
jgi:hypothetical protein